MNASIKIIFPLTLHLISVRDWSVRPWIFGPLVCVYSITSVFRQLVCEYWSVGPYFVTESVFYQLVSN